MPSLHELERAVAAGIYAADPAAAAHVRAGRFPAEQHLQVYRHNVFESLTGALKAVYPVVERLVGEGFFRYAAEAYIRRHPPASGNLHDFGGGFAAFLTAFAPAAALVYLPDVARLEWAWHEAFHAADAPALALERLAEVPSARYGELRFTLHPSARLIESEYPCLRIWQVNQPDWSGDETVDLAEGGVRLLVIRRGLEVRIEPLSPGEHALLAALAARQPFAASAEAALAAEHAFDLAGRLRWHVGHATLTAFSY
jgi:hypothetical protein